MPMYPYDFTVTTTPQIVAGYDPYRTSLVITNRSGVVVYFGYSASLTATTGLKDSGAPILANNGRVQLNRNSGDDPRLAIWAVVATGTATVNVLEGVQTNGA